MILLNFALLCSIALLVVQTTSAFFVRAPGVTPHVPTNLNMAADRPRGVYYTPREPEPEPVRPVSTPTKKEHKEADLTFSRWLQLEAYRHQDMQGVLPILSAVEQCCKTLSQLTRRAQVDDLAGMYEEGAAINIQGEAQKKLDVISNRIMVSILCSPGCLSCVASEEEEYPQMCRQVVGHSDFTGEYAAVFDPLDGSANIGAGLPCGTVFGILKRPPGGKVGPSTVLQLGAKQVAAGYCLYGGQTIMVITVGRGVFQFTLDKKRNSFVLTASDMKIKPRGDIYSTNEANSMQWDPRIQDYINDMKRGKRPGQTPMQYVYNGALVADIHNILNRGGIFLYPSDNKNPNGKLRLLYECNPIAMIMEQAGGVATTGFERILDVAPFNTHHRVPAAFGSKDDVLDFMSYMKRPL